MKKISIAFLSCFFLNLFFLSADAPQRDATDAEKKYHREMMTLFEKIKPVFPEGWSETDRTEYYELERVTQGTEEGPMSFDYQWKYSNPNLQENYQNQINEMMNQFENEKPREITEWEQRQASLSNELVDMSFRRDIIHQRQIQKELDELNAKISRYYDELQNKGAVTSFPEPPKDTYAEVDIKVNSFEWFFSKEIKIESEEKGFIRIRDGKDGWKENNGWIEGITYLFLGPWEIKDKKEEGAELKAMIRKDIPYTKVQTMVIRIEGDKNRVQSILDAMPIDIFRRKMD